MAGERTKLMVKVRRFAVVTSTAEGDGSEIPATRSVRHEHSDMPAALLLLFNRLESGKKSGVLCGSEQRRGWLKDRVEGQRRQVGLVPEPLS